MDYALEAGVLKANPPVFWPKRLPPRLSEGAVVVAGAGVPKEKPPVLAAGALQEHTMQITLRQTPTWRNNHTTALMLVNSQKAVQIKGHEVTCLAQH